MLELAVHAISWTALLVVVVVTGILGLIQAFQPTPGGGMGRVRLAAPAALGLTTPQAGSDPKGAPGAAGAQTASTSVNVGAQGVPATRTSAGAEGSFTTTTITLPKSGRPTTVTVSISTASCLVQVSTVGGYFVAGVVQAANPPLVLDVSFLPESTTVAVQTQASAAAVIGMVANFA